MSNLVVWLPLPGISPAGCELFFVVGFLGGIGAVWWCESGGVVVVAGHKPRKWVTELHGADVYFKIAS